MTTARSRLALLLATAALATACGSGSTLASASGHEAGPQAVARLPVATLATLDGHGTLDTADLVGTPAVVNFWATWCAPCVEEMPDLQAVHRQVGDRVRFVGVDRADVAERGRELAARTGVTYTLVTDPDSTFFAAAGARAMPTTLFVAADGAIVHRHAGPLDDVTLRALIAEHLGV